MTKTDDIEQRWRDLAEQLGLPPEPAASNPLPPTARAEAEPEPSRAEKPVAEPHSSQIESEESPQPALDDQRESNFVPTRGVEEGRTSRGRRRGRRGGRREEPEPLEPSEAAMIADEAPAAEDTRVGEQNAESPPPRERSRRRGRGRSRHDKAAPEKSPASAAREEGDDQPAEAPETSNGGGDDDGDDMSGWSIPSWQELIDSLYRPDR